MRAYRSNNCADFLCEPYYPDCKPLTPNPKPQTSKLCSTCVQELNIPKHYILNPTTQILKTRTWCWKGKFPLSI